MKNNIKVLSVLPLLGQPRYSKRISMLQELDFNIEVVTFERDYHKGRIPNVNITSLGKISNGKYIQRIFKLIRALPVLRNAMKKSDIVYASGPDMAYMALLAGVGLRKSVILEVGDIREIQVQKGLVGTVVRMIDKYLVQKCSLLVSTAPGFITEYYEKWLKVKLLSIVLENKLEKKCDSKIADKKTNKICIGYFGLLRCDWSWGILKKLAILYPNNIEVLLAGYPINPVNIQEQANAINNVKFLGEYKSPDDLSRLYGQVDLIWACYPHPNDSDWNWKWARTNRFYESICFKKPMIVLEGSGDADIVRKQNIGKIIPLIDVNKIVRILRDINYKELNIWSRNLNKLSDSIYLYTTEKEELKKIILEII